MNLFNTVSVFLVINSKTLILVKILFWLKIMILTRIKIFGIGEKDITFTSISVLLLKIFKHLIYQYQNFKGSTYQNLLIVHYIEVRYIETHCVNNGRLLFLLEKGSQMLEPMLVILQIHKIQILLNLR